MNSHAPSEWLRPSADFGDQVSMRVATDLRRSVTDGLPICSTPQDGPHAYLVETGVVAAYALCGRTPPTCVALIGPGVLFEAGAGADFSYRAVGSVTLFRISATLVEREFHREPALREMYLAQLQERLVRAELLIACSLRHTLLERCSRWLLGLRGHFGENVPVTHQFLASLLGVRRAGVSATLERLQRENVISQRRGRIKLVDPARLADYACECRTECIQSEHPIPAQLLQNSFAIDGAGGRPTVGVTELLAQSNGAIQVSRRLLDETWRLRSSALRVLHGGRPGGAYSGAPFAK
jgi:CRP-like cAMP-binding protein